MADVLLRPVMERTHDQLLSGGATAQPFLVGFVQILEKPYLLEAFKSLWQYRTVAIKRQVPNLE
jgi:hypothetical protein